MAQELPSSAATAQQGSVGPYDLAIFLAKSLGTALPFVVMIALVVWGAIYVVREVNNYQKESAKLQSELNKTRQQLIEAQESIRQAKSEAKAQALQAYSEQLEKQNAQSADVYKRVQELVTGQLDNMKKMEDSSKSQLDSLHSQIAETEEKLNQSNELLSQAKEKLEKSTLTTTLVSYTEMLQDIAKESQGSYIQPALLTKMQNKLDDQAVFSQAKNDANDTARPVPLRIVLYIALLEKTSDGQYLQSMMSLLNGNKAAATAAIAGLLVQPSPFSEFSYSNSNWHSLLVKCVLDNGFRPEFRDTILNSFGFLDPSKLKSLSQDDFRSVVRYAGKRLLQLSASQYGSCRVISDGIKQLNTLSPEAALVFVWQASNSKIGGYVESETGCIKTELDKAMNGHRPSEDAIKLWLQSETASLAQN